MTGNRGKKSRSIRQLDPPCKPKTHGCFDPEELPGGTRFADLKGRPPPPCYSCGQNAKPRPKGEGSGGPVAAAEAKAKAKKVDAATGLGLSGGPATTRRKSSKRRPSAISEGGKSSKRSSKASSARPGEEWVESEVGTLGKKSKSAVSGSPSRTKGSEAEQIKSGSGPAGSVAGSAAGSVGSGGGSEKAASGRAPYGAGAAASGSGVALGAAAGSVAGRSPSALGKVESVTASGRKSVLPDGGRKPGATFADEVYGVPGPAGDFLKMMSFLAGLAAGYGLSSVICNLNRCKVLTILRNLRDVTTFLCSERCNGP